MSETAIKRAADRKNLSAARIAEIVGVTRQAVEGWFRGDYRPDTDKARILIPLLDLTWDEMYPPKKVSNG